MKNLRPSEVRERTGISRRRLEYWREQGLVCPSTRSGGGHARYSDRDLRRLRLLTVLTSGEGGLSLQRAGRVLERLHREVEGMLEVARAESSAKALQELRSR